MAYNKLRDNGMTTHSSWVHIPSQTITEGDEAQALADRKYAQLVHIVGNTASTTTPTSSLLLENDPPKAVIVSESSPYTYIAEAEPGTVTTDAAWRVKRIEVSGSDTIITWADGDGNFDNVANSFGTLSFS